MKIGLLIYGSIDTVSGGYLYDRMLVSHLRSHGDEVRVLSIPARSYASHLLDNVRFRLPSGLDILIEDELVHPSVLAWNARRTAGQRVPILSLVHNLHSSERRARWKNTFYRQVEILHLRSVDGYIFNSETTYRSVVQLVGEGRPFVLAPPGGDRLGSLPAHAVRERVARGGPLRLVFLANVTPLKGLHVVLEALKRLPPALCTLDVAGSLDVDALYADRMKREASTLSTAVVFHGVLDGRPLVELLSRSDVLVLPSFYEGFGIAYLEGMAFGLPAIGTTAGAIPQMISEGQNGYLITPGDSGRLAALLEGLASDRLALARMSENALEHFSACPTWTQSGEIVRNFLQQLLKEG